MWQIDLSIDHKAGPLPVMFDSGLQHVLAMLRQILLVLQRIGIQNWIGDAKIRVQYIKAVRDWKGWFLGESIGWHACSPKPTATKRSTFHPTNFWETSCLTSCATPSCSGLQRRLFPMQVDWSLMKLECMPSYFCDVQASCILFIFTMTLPAGLNERMQMLLLLLPICPDIPPGYSITAHGRGAALESHRDDVILLLKRNAADDELCQDMLLLDLLWAVLNFQISQQAVCRIPHSCFHIDILLWWVLTQPVQEIWRLSNQTRKKTIWQWLMLCCENKQQKQIVEVSNFWLNFAHPPTLGTSQPWHGSKKSLQGLQLWSVCPQLWGEWLPLWSSGPR